MKAPHISIATGPQIFFIGCFALLATLVRADQNLAGNVTVTGGPTAGNLAVTGAIDSDSNTFTFGTQGASFGAALLYQDASADTFTFNLNRSPASWLWQHLSGIAAMRLDANHQLIVYQSDGTTAGITLTPSNSSLKLGSLVTLTGDSSGVLTVNGPLAVAGNFTNTNGSFTGGASGLTLNAGGTNQNVTLNASGTGDLVFNAGGIERARIKSTGNVGIGTTSPATKLYINADTTNGLQVTTANEGPWGLIIKNATYSGGGFTVYQADDGSAGLFSNYPNGSRLTLGAAGNIGIGTTRPGAKLEVQGALTGLPALSGASQPNASLRLGNVQTNGVLDIGVNSGSGAWLQYTNQTDLTQSYPLLLNPNGGNVGIGTTNPADKLHVVGNIFQSAVGRIDNVLVDTTAATNAKWWAWSLNGAMGANSFGLHTRDDAGVYVQTAIQFNRSGSDIASVLVPNGNVGIGTSDPQAKLQVGSWNLIRDGTWAPPLTPGNTSAGERLVFYQNPSWKTAIGMDGQNGIWFQAHTPGGQVAYQWFTGNAATAPNEKMRIMENGNVGIGTVNPTHKLSVNGTIRAKEIIVDTGWADYVFDESYRLAPLSEVESHIKAEKHLPGIPSAQEVAEHGVSMGDMQAKLLSKIEELTLHLIRLEKENDLLRQRVNALEQHP